MEKKSTYLKLIGLHVVIGVLIYFNESLAKGYFFIALGYFLYRIFYVDYSQKTIEVLKACGYFVGAEVLLRMTKGAISYEAAKYLVILFVLIGMFYKGISGKGYPYFLYLMLLIPSIFVASTTLSFDANFRTNIAFVLSGPVCLGIAALFCYDKRLNSNQLNAILVNILLPIIALTAYIYFYNPSVKDVLSNTASNRTASGGFGPNQVSTVLGLGVLIAAIRLLLKSPTLIIKIVNGTILILIGFRALVTFSRGGVIAAIITLGAFIIFYYIRSNYKEKKRIFTTTILIGVCFLATWFITSQQTDGFIEFRYTNKDHLGRTKSDLTTGRGELFQNELEGFIRQPFLGIGSSRAKDRRLEIEGQGVTSHSEVSRTLAEHGILGVIILLILIFKPFDIRSYNRTNYFFFAFLAFWFATINHSSMRIAAPAFVYALALIKIKNEKNPICRKRIKVD